MIAISDDSPSEPKATSMHTWKEREETGNTISLVYTDTSAQITI